MTTLDERHGEGARDGDEPRGEVALGLAPAYGPATVPLREPLAAVVAKAGSKAANLARAAGAGLPVLPGFVIPYQAQGDPHSLRRAWQALSDGGSRPLVVRSSSPQEDTEESSLAGQFASVLDVRGWQDFRTAVRTVLDSARRADGSAAPMAVLVQPMLTARVGGVMFGADPVEGRTDRMLVSAVRGGPDSLVSGAQQGTNYWLSGRGRLLRTESAEAEPPLTRRELFRLARLARRARQVFGGPQDIEFGFDEDGRLWLFQSRPITAMAARPARGARLLGPGPVAETLPDQLLPLEEDLWVAPMARGLAAALDIGGTAPRRLLRSAPVVTTVGGRAAADLRLLGAVPPRHRWLALLNPAPGARRLAAAWRVGRLAAALPGLTTDLVADVDRLLAEVPAPGDLSPAALADELRWTRRALVSLHAQEALAGALLPQPPSGRTAAGTALAALTAARARGIPDERIVATDPVVLALTAPSLRNPVRLPSASGGATAQEPARDAVRSPVDGPRFPAEDTTNRPHPPDTPPQTPDRHGTRLPADATNLPAEGTTNPNPPHAPTEPPAQTPDTHGTRHPANAPNLPAEVTANPPRPPHAPTEPPAQQPGRNAVRPPANAPNLPAEDTANPNLPHTPTEPPAQQPGRNAVRPPDDTRNLPFGAPPTGAAPAEGLAQRPAREGTVPPADSRPTPDRASPASLPPREALRLRIRWAQELQVRLVREAARRVGTNPARVGLMRWPELADALHGHGLPADLADRTAPAATPPLPDSFRLAGGGVVVAEGFGGRGNGMRGVSAGRAVGTAWDGLAPRPPDPVLVVRSLDPGLAPLLPGLTGLVAQTGSPLSHLAVLAREFRLPAVVGVADAVERFPAGTRLTVDGTAGDVRLGDGS
nr:PEP-utilizing enzyme [Streptomyces sp. SBE_14.2]